MTDISYARKTYGAVKLQKPSELAAKRGMVLVIAGASNAGKTSLLKTLWESERIRTVCLADARGRAHVLPDYEGLSVAQIKKWSDWSDFNKAFIAEPKAFDAVVVDTYSEIQAMDLKNRGLYNAADKDRIGIYNDSHMDMSDTTRNLYDLATQHGVHIILTLWLKSPHTDPKTGIETTRMYLTDQFESYFRGIVDYIGVLTLGNAPNLYPPVLSFRPSNSTPQKFSPSYVDYERMATIPKEIYQPSLGHLIDTFMGDPWPADAHKLKRPV